MARFRMKREGIAAGFRIGEINQIAREVANDVGMFWHRNYLDKHFTPAGAREYGYTPRNGDRGSGRRFAGSYTERKYKLFGHRNPLEYTGQSRLWLKTPRLRVTATQGQARLRILLGAPNFNRFAKGGRYGSSMVDLTRDITAVTDKEVQEMTQFAGDQFMQKYRSLRASRGAA